MSLYEPKSSLLSVKYYPDGDVLTENPPRFTWLPAGEDGPKYCVEISKDKDFNEKIERTDIPYNFYTLDIVLENGEYYWRYCMQDEPDQYSAVRSFVINGDLPETPLLDKKKRYDEADSAHPRLWLDNKKIEVFREKLKADGDYCGFNEFFKHSVEPYLDWVFPEEPLPYPDNKRVVSIWRSNYMLCQEVLCYIRSFSVPGVILEDTDLIDKAKKALLELSGWDVNGPTSRDYNDECAFRVVYALGFGYDWLYAYLSEQERETVLDSLFTRTKEVAEHVIVNSRIHYSLYDSHAVRSLSAVLTPCCIAMLFEKEEAKQWLDYTIEYFSTVYTPWGGADGGWAEGPMYWTTGMAYLIDALNLIKSFIGIDLFKRPFFQNTGRYILNCNPVDTYQASFCDQSNLGQRPGIKTGFEMRQFGAISGNSEYIWFYERVRERSILNPQDFFNKGWWDLYFDDMVFRHDYGMPPGAEPSNALTVKWFKDIGWVAVNKNMADFDEHVFFLTKSSGYGSVSHSHGDQNTFALHAFGEPLIIESGYYIGFLTTMHIKWRKQTISTNSILIDGEGQYAQLDKTRQLKATGKVLEVRQEADHVYIKEDATDAYRENISYLDSCVREIYFIDEEYFVIVDKIRLSKAGVASFLLHSMYPFNIKGNTFTIKGEKSCLKGKIIHTSSDMADMTESDEFVEVDPDEIKGLDKQYHLRMDTKANTAHTIITLLHPVKKGSSKYISAIKDDQGYDLYFYFDNNGKLFKLTTSRE